MARDLAKHTELPSRPVSRRHTISACDTKNGKKVSAPSQHAPVLEEDDEVESSAGGGFQRYHASRHLTKAKLVSYREKHRNNSVHARPECQQNAPAPTCINNRHSSELTHAGHCLLSKSHGNLIDSSFSVSSDHMHDVLSSDSCRLHRSVSVASMSDCQRCHSPRSRPVRSQSPQTFAGRPESPVRHLSRSETFTCSIPRKSKTCIQSDTHIATRCDSPQTRAMKRMDSFPPRCSSPSRAQREESPRRHSVHVQSVHRSLDSACALQTSCDKPRRHSSQHVHGCVSQNSRTSHRSVGKEKHECRDASCSDHIDIERTSSPKFNNNHSNRLRSHRTHSEEQSTKSREISGEKKHSSVSDFQDIERVSTDSSDGPSVRRSRTSIVRARSRPEVNVRSRNLVLKEKEEENFKLIENAGKVGASNSAQVSKTVSFRERPVSAFESRQQSRPSATRLKSEPRPASRLVLSTAKSDSDKSTRMKGMDTDTSGEVKSNSEQTELDSDSPLRSRREVKLSRQSAIRTERPDVKERIQQKSETDKDINDVTPRESRIRRVGVVSREIRRTSESSLDKTERRKSATEKMVATRQETSLARQEVSSSENEEHSSRSLFKPVRPVIRSRSEVRPRPEVKPLKGSHNLPVDFENNDLDNSVDKLVIIPPPEFRDPVDSEESPEKVDSDSTIGDIGDIPDVIKTSKAEFKVADLLHVSWQCETTPVETSSSNMSNPATDFRIPATVSTSYTPIPFSSYVQFT